MGQPNVYVPISAEALTAQDRIAECAFREPAVQAVVRFGNVSRIGAAAGHGMSGAGTLCGGVLCTKDCCLTGEHGQVSEIQSFRTGHCESRRSDQNAWDGFIPKS